MSTPSFPPSSSSSITHSSQAPSRPRLTRASTASAIDLRRSGSLPPALAPLTPQVPYPSSYHHPQSPSIPSSHHHPAGQPVLGASGRPLQHRKTLSSAVPDSPNMATLTAPLPSLPPSAGGWPKPALGRMSSIPSLPSSGVPTPSGLGSTTTPPISPRTSAPGYPFPQQPYQPLPPSSLSSPAHVPPRSTPTPLHTPPHSQSPPSLPSLPPSSPAPPLSQQGPPRSGPLHPTKFSQHYSVSIYLPKFSPDWITIAQRKGNSLLIVGDNYESDGHYEWSIPFGPDAKMDTLRAKFNNEHLEITVNRGGVLPMPEGGPVMGLGMGMGRGALGMSR